MIALAQLMAGTAMFLFWLSGRMSGYIRGRIDGRVECERTHRVGRSRDGRFFSLKAKPHDASSDPTRNGRL